MGGGSSGPSGVEQKTPLAPHSTLAPSRGFPGWRTAATPVGARTQVNALGPAEGLVRVRAGERPVLSRPAAPRPAPGLGHLPGKLVVDCCPRVAPGRGHGIWPWNLRRGLASPGSGRESGTQTGTPARTETATRSDSGIEPRTGAGRETGASGGTGTGTGGGTETPAWTDTSSGTIALVNKEFGKNPAKAGRGTDLSGPGTQPRPPGPHLGKPRSRRPTGRRSSGTVDQKGEVGLLGPLRPRHR